MLGARCWIPAYAGMAGNVNTTWWFNTLVLKGSEATTW